MHVNRPTESVRPGRVEDVTERATPRPRRIPRGPAPGGRGRATLPMDLLIEFHSHHRTSLPGSRHRGRRRRTGARRRCGLRATRSAAPLLPEMRIEPLHEVRMTADSTKRLGSLRAESRRARSTIEIPREARGPMRPADACAARCSPSCEARWPAPRERSCMNEPCRLTHEHPQSRAADTTPALLWSLPFVAAAGGHRALSRWLAPKWWATRYPHFALALGVARRRLLRGLLRRAANACCIRLTSTSSFIALIGSLFVVFGRHSHRHERRTHSPSELCCCWPSAPCSPTWWAPPARR